MQAMIYACNSCNIGTSDLPDMYAQSLRAAGPKAYISGKSQVPMLQLICNIAKGKKASDKCHIALVLEC